MNIKKKKKKRKGQTRTSIAYDTYKLWRKQSNNRLFSTKFCLGAVLKYFLAEVLVTFLKVYSLGGISLSMSGCKSIEGQFFPSHVTLLFKDYFTFYIKPY